MNCYSGVVGGLHEELLLELAVLVIIVGRGGTIEVAIRYFDNIRFGYAKVLKATVMSPGPGRPTPRWVSSANSGAGVSVCSPETTTALPPNSPEVKTITQ